MDSEDGVTASVKILLREAFEKALPGREPKDLGALADKIIFEAREAVAGDTPLFCQKLTQLIKNLGTRYGEMLDKTLATELSEGRITVAEIFRSDPSSFVAVETPRRLICSKLYGLLSRSGPGREASDDRTRQLAKSLEKGIYNRVIRSSQTQGSTVVRSWDNPAFVSLYSSRAWVVLSHLDPDSAVVKEYGPRLAEKLYSGEILPEEASALTTEQLCPEGFAHEKGVISVRSQQVVEERTSALWSCPNCRKRSCTYREVQERSSDEPASIYCRCTFCGFQFRAPS